MGLIICQICGEEISLSQRAHTCDVVKMGRRIKELEAQVEAEQRNMREVSGAFQLLLAEVAPFIRSSDCVLVKSATIKDIFDALQNQLLDRIPYVKWLVRWGALTIIRASVVDLFKAKDQMPVKLRLLNLRENCILTRDALTQEDLMVVEALIENIVGEYGQKGT